MSRLFPARNLNNHAVVIVDLRCCFFAQRESLVSHAYLVGVDGLTHCGSPAIFELLLFGKEAFACQQVDG